MICRGIRGSDFPPCRRRWLAAWLLVALSGTWASPAAEVSRSLAMPRSQRPDERTLAEPGVRKSHVGWEIRSPHFVVVSAQSAQQASQTAQELEQAWSAMAQLADRWTTVHRQAGFGRAAVGVLLTSGNRFTTGAPAAGPRAGTEGAELFLNLAEGPWAERLPQMRREVCAAFLRVAQQDALLPAWTRVALAEYLGGQPLPQGSGTPLGPPPVGQASWTAEEHERAQLWGHFLLEGNDAAHAPEFLAALGTTVAARSRALDAHALHQPWGMSEGGREGSAALTALVNKAMAEGEMAAWLRDPALGQPLVHAEPQELAAEARTQDLVLILKLARRLGVLEASDGGSQHAPKQSEFPVPASTTAKNIPATRGATWTLAELERRLNASGQPLWATLDAQGRLLFSDEQPRFRALLAPTDRQYHTVRGEQGETILQATFPDGQVVQAWLTANAENPQRPLVYLRQVTATSPTAERPTPRIFVR